MEIYKISETCMKATYKGTGEAFALFGINNEVVELVYLDDRAKGEIRDICKTEVLKTEMVFGRVSGKDFLTSAHRNSSVKMPVPQQKLKRTTARTSIRMTAQTTDRIEASGESVADRREIIDFVLNQLPEGQYAELEDKVARIKIHELGGIPG